MTFMLIYAENELNETQAVFFLVKKFFSSFFIH